MIRMWKSKQSAVCITCDQCLHISAIEPVFSWGQTCEVAMHYEHSCHNFVHSSAEANIHTSTNGCWVACICWGSVHGTAGHLSPSWLVKAPGQCWVESKRGSSMTCSQPWQTTAPWTSDAQLQMAGEVSSLVCSLRTEGCFIIFSPYSLVKQSTLSAYQSVYINPINHLRPFHWRNWN